ncbi:MAG TPA: toast rack family protein [Anaerolineaceae bacterium]
MKLRLLSFLMVLVLLTSACSITINLPEVTTGEIRTFNFAEPAPASGPASVSIEMGAGKIEVKGGAAGLIEGSVDYNVEGWKPVTTSKPGEFHIIQKTEGIPTSKVINEWKIKLGNTPVKLSIATGANEGVLDLGGIPITDLKISDGASKANIRFDKPNPETMKSFTYNTGASNSTLSGLANANFTEMRFECGAGNYTLDFGGKLRQNSRVVIKTGVSNLRIEIPKETAAKVNLSGGVKNVNIEGTWTVKNDTYQNSGEGSLLTIEVDAGVGNIVLVNK